MTGRTHELKAEKTTIGRVEDNTFQIAEASVSSHHCEVLLRGATTWSCGTSIPPMARSSMARRSPRSVIKPGQILRLGQIEMRLETDAPAASGKKHMDQTMVMQRGVSLNELEQGTRGGGFDTKGSGFSKKTTRSARSSGSWPAWLAC